MSSTPSLHDYLRVLRERWITVVVALLVVPAVALAVSLRQDERYEATAEVLLTSDNLAASLTETNGRAPASDPGRIAATQARLARAPGVAARALQRAGLRQAPSALLASSEVAPVANTDLLQFTVRASSPERAELLATSYATEFTEFRRDLDTEELATALEDVRSELRGLEAAGFRNSDLARRLLDKRQQLRTLLTLQVGNAKVVRPAAGADQVAPRTVRNVLLGCLLGLALGVALAFLLHALDTRPRRPDEAGDRLGLPVLAAIPAPPRRLRKEGLVMLEQPRSDHADRIRRLRTNIELATLADPARALMITSGVAGEGKSTTAANLAVALARAGRRVALVDLDLRRPRQHELFRVKLGPGVAEVVGGRRTLDEALQNAAPVGISGSLVVLTAGAPSDVPDELVSSAALRDVIAELHERADVVIIDAAPLLQPGDAAALTAYVDALVLVTRLGVLKRAELEELHRTLAELPTRTLGIVATGVAPGSGGTRYAQAATEVRAPERVA